MSSKSAATRKANAAARFAGHVADFQAYAQGKEWVSSKEIHAAFVLPSDGLYGRIKAELGIPHRRAKDAQGKTVYEWNLGVIQEG